MFCQECGEPAHAGEMTLAEGRSICPSCAGEAYDGRFEATRRDLSSKLKSRYSISVDDYEMLFKAQGGRCAVCGTRPKGRRPRLVVDHDHSSGLVRGLLCGNCNAGIGMLGDSASGLRSAVRYLDDPPAQKKLPPGT